MDDWILEPWDRTHLRADFQCGKVSLDDFIHSFVSQYEKRHLGRTVVAVRPGDRRIWGYYTLASSALAFAHLPAKSAKKLPKHPVPVVLLGRLAVDREAQGQGLGEVLLLHALQRALDLSRQLGIYAVEVDALDDEAKAFYERYTFVPLLDNERHLFLPMTVVEAMLGS